MTSDDTSLEDTLPDKYQLESDEETGASVVHRRDGSPIGRYHAEDGLLLTDIAVDLGFAADRSDDELEALGSEAVASIEEPWLSKGFERGEGALAVAEDPEDDEATPQSPVYVAQLRRSVASIDEAADLVEWLTRRDHFYYGDDVLES